jgi:hypothetical protein
MDVATHTNEGPHEVLNLNLAAGNTLTTHEAIPFGDLTPYLSANLNQNLGGGSDFTNFSLTPGIRFFVGWHTYFIRESSYQSRTPNPSIPGLLLSSAGAGERNSSLKALPPVADLQL